MAFHQGPRNPNVRAYHTVLAAAARGQLAGRVAELPELTQPVAMPVAESSFSSVVVQDPGESFSNPLTSLLPSLSILQLFPFAAMDHTVLSMRFAEAHRGNISIE